MKLVIGIVRPEKTNDVLEALYRAEVRGQNVDEEKEGGGRQQRGQDAQQVDPEQAL